jgi:hypothetical protein
MSIHSVAFLLFPWLTPEESSKLALGNKDLTRQLRDHAKRVAWFQWTDLVSPRAKVVAVERPPPDIHMALAVMWPAGLERRMQALVLTCPLQQIVMRNMTGSCRHEYMPRTYYKHLSLWNRAMSEKWGTAALRRHARAWNHYIVQMKHYAMWVLHHVPERFVDWRFHAELVRATDSRSIHGVEWLALGSKLRSETHAALVLLSTVH